MYDTNPELDREVVRAIIESVTQRNSILTYGDLAKIVGANRDMVMSAQSFGSALGRIQDYCLKLDLPSLPVMVTNKSGNPEEGFIAHYREIHPGLSNLSDKEIIRSERQKCLTCKDWQTLYDFVGIKEPVPATVDVMGQRANTPIYEEGERIAQVLREEIKRNPAARIACLAEKGHRCVVCENDLEEIYGVSGIIHVHHLKPLHESIGIGVVDPSRDLVPVCPNCHAVIHSKRNDFGQPDVYTPNEVRAMFGLPPLEEY